MSFETVCRSGTFVIRWKDFEDWENIPNSGVRPSSVNADDHASELRSLRNQGAANEFLSQMRETVWRS